MTGDMLENARPGWCHLTERQCGAGEHLISVAKARSLDGPREAADPDLRLSPRIGLAVAADPGDLRMAFPARG